MARFLLMCFILVEVLLVNATVNAGEAGSEHILPRVGPVAEPSRVLGLSDPPASSAALESEGAEAPEIRRLGKHHSSDKSIAGGGVIIGGLATAVVAGVFCYIRVTRKTNRDG